MTARALTRVTLAFVGLAALVACHKDSPAPSAPTPVAAAASTEQWQLLASELPQALLSVSGRSASDVYAVGADKGSGPLVLHFDGEKWQELHTGQKGDLWWVQALAGGPTLMAGSGGMILRSDGQRFDRVATPGTTRQTVYGVWGSSGDDFYAVGNTDGRSGFIWHFHGGAIAPEALPKGLPTVAGGDAGSAAPGFFKVWGTGDDVWVVGAAGTVLHKKGAAPFEIVPSPAKDTLFTVSGVGPRLLAVGGGSNGIILDGRGGVLRDVSPPAAGLLQGVFANDTNGDWASGERGMVYTRSGNGPFAAVDHGLVLPARSSLHSIFVDPSGGIWSAGGNVLTTALDEGILIHYGARISPVIVEDSEAEGGATKLPPAESHPTGTTGVSR